MQSSLKISSHLRRFLAREIKKGGKGVNELLRVFLVVEAQIHKIGKILSKIEILRINENNIVAKTWLKFG